MLPTCTQPTNFHTAGWGRPFTAGGTFRLGPPRGGWPGSPFLILSHDRHLAEGVALGSRRGLLVGALGVTEEVKLAFDEPAISFALPELDVRLEQVG